ncbi:MAG: hypothetical protein IPG96_15790 [Proteobacteria bacterium]|nr:hypothetical protein [Pseudomonadota bacterium]
MAVSVFSEITCEACGTVHRSRRDWPRTPIHYVYRCKRCGAAIHFSVAQLRWRFCPTPGPQSPEDTSLQTMPLPLETIGGEADSAGGTGVRPRWTRRPTRRGFSAETNSH